MANSFVTVKEIARQALPRLIENLVFPNLIYKDFKNDFVGKKGTTIQVRKPVKYTAADFSGNVSTQDMKEDSVTVKLDRIADALRPGDVVEVGRYLVDPRPALLAAVQVVAPRLHLAELRGELPRAADVPSR